MLAPGFGPFIVATISDTLEGMRCPGIVLLCGLVACGHARPRVGVRSAEIIGHASELGREGQAQLQTVTDADGDQRPGDSRNVTLDQPVTFKGTSTTLLLLLQGCPPFAGTSPCRISARERDLVYLRPTGPGLLRPGRDAPPPPPDDDGFPLKVVMGTLSVTSLAGVALCLAYCESNKAEKSVALGGSSVLFLLLWALTSGNARD